MKRKEKIEWCLIGSSASLEGMRDMIRGYWYISDEHDPLKPTDNPKQWDVCTVTKECTNHRVIKRGSRYRFEFASML